MTRTQPRGGDLPTFIVIGAMKGGTTSLYHYLRDHPQVFMTGVKELDFFIEESNWSRGLGWYRQQFSGAGTARARGEASTMYTKYPRYSGVPARMAAVVPDVRLVYVVRDPISRMRSHYEHRRALGAETRPPDEALLSDPIYLDCSRYALQLEQYLDHFPREQLLVVTSESLRSDRVATVSGVQEFLGVDPDVSSAALDTEYYQSAQRRTYPPAVWRARRFVKRHVPQVKRAKELVDSVVTGGRLAGLRAEPASRPRTELSPPLRERLTDLLRDDVARLRPHMPAAFDGWGIA